MTDTPVDSRSGAHYAAAALGELAGLDRFRFRHPALPFEVEGKVFLSALLGLTSAEISLNKLPPGASMPFHHRHRLNEEIYIFLRGHGEFRVDDDVFPVSEGSVVRVAPDGVRCWRNLSRGAAALSKHLARPCAKCLQSRGACFAPTALRLGNATLALRWVPTQLSGALRQRSAIPGSSDEPLYYVVIQAPAGGHRGDTISDGALVPKPVRWETET